jgi:hypothetical protein
MGTLRCSLSPSFLVAGRRLGATVESRWMEVACCGVWRLRATVGGRGPLQVPGGHSHIICKILVMLVQLKKQKKKNVPGLADVRLEPCPFIILVLVLAACGSCRSLLLSCSVRVSTLEPCRFIIQMLCWRWRLHATG